MATTTLSTYPRADRAQATVTHRDRRAREAAAFVTELSALCARAASARDRFAMVRKASWVLTLLELSDAVDRAVALVQSGAGAEQVARLLGTPDHVTRMLGLVCYCFLLGCSPLDAVERAAAHSG